MKILHVCLSCFYIDNHTYQENLLPKFHKKLGYDVEIIASQENFDSNGNLTKNGQFRQYINENGIKVTRLNYIKLPLSNRLKIYQNTKKYISESNPDIIFVHGSQFLDLKIIYKYCEINTNVKLYIDNHADFSNSANTFISRFFLHKFIWRLNIGKVINRTEKFYGVLPARVDFLTNMYKIPEEKVSFLPMGADNDEIERSKKEIIIKNLRQKLGIQKDDFLIITGGKIDEAKIQTIDLINIIKKNENNKVKIVVFGSIIESLQEKIYSLVDNKKVFYVGWISPNETYDFLAIADLVVFPGRHSVLWEQSVAMGVPTIFKYWEGTTHVNINGNALFVYDDNFEELRCLISKLSSDTCYYNDIFNKANIAANLFLYEEIAKKSIELELV